MNLADRQAALRLVPALATLVEELEIYERLLVKWQSKLNLIGRSTIDDIWVRHFGDAAQLTGLASLSRRWADLGSGAGFPGMVVAIAMKHHRAGEMHLIESDKRKASFLREVSRETGAMAIIHNARCEDVLTDIAPEVIVSRAMASLDSLVGYATPFVDNGAIALFMKGRDIASELTHTSIPSNFSLSVSRSQVDPDSSIVRIKAV
ncbi:MAG: 16S rRNA (guanine(527)-N(7))-methyltransferase RsmG [Rhodoblastus sp.]